MIQINYSELKENYFSRLNLGASNYDKLETIKTYKNSGVINNKKLTW